MKLCRFDAAIPACHLNSAPLSRLGSVGTILSVAEDHGFQLS
jgi:hypothetical protein